MANTYKGGVRVVTVSVEVGKTIDRLVELENKRTGYNITSRNIIERAVRELSMRMNGIIDRLKTVKVKKVKKTKKFNIGKAKWTPSQRAKFRATMAAKKKPVETVEIPKEEETSLQTTV